MVGKFGDYIKFCQIQTNNQKTNLDIIPIHQLHPKLHLPFHKCWRETGKIGENQIIPFAFLHH